MKKTINKLTKAGNPTGEWNEVFGHYYYKGFFRYGRFSGYRSTKKHRSNGYYFKRDILHGFSQFETNALASRESSTLVRIKIINIQLIFF